MQNACRMGDEVAAAGAIAVADGVGVDVAAAGVVGVGSAALDADNGVVAGVGVVHVAAAVSDVVVPMVMVLPPVAMGLV